MFLGGKSNGRQTHLHSAGMSSHGRCDCIGMRQQPCFAVGERAGKQPCPASKETWDLAHVVFRADIVCHLRCRVESTLHDSMEQPTPKVRPIRVTSAKKLICVQPTVIAS